MKTQPILRQRGFTLLETVIAIGVLAVLLTGFMVVFAPAAEGIRKSINVQQADRMASALEQELVTLRKNEIKTDVTTGFDKAFDWIKSSSAATSTDALLAYQYRGKLTNPRSDDGTLTPEPLFSGKPGEDYVVVPMVRRLSDSAKLKEDLAAVEGAVYLVKCTQLVFSGGQLIANTDPGTIKNPKPKPTPDTDPPYDPGPFDKAAKYPEAVIAFAADFYLMPAKSTTYFTSTAFTSKFSKLKNPVFTRNLAVRR
jgi:prepilin-type N-terminal cleavage/methylation domain-containing protein